MDSKIENWVNRFETGPYCLGENFDDYRKAREEQGLVGGTLSMIHMLQAIY